MNTEIKMRNYELRKGLNIQVGTIKGNSGKNKYERTYYHIKIDKTLLVVVPFFSGSYGLNSYYLLNEMGKVIKNLLNNN